jgi:ABC-type uncharacterized transport system auxiliary subunit
MTRTKSLRRALLCAAALLAAPTLTACLPTITAAEITQLGTRAYPRQSPGQLLKASTVALKTLGFQIAVVDPGALRVKTAPKVQQVHAVGGAYSASTIADSLAWTIDVSVDHGVAVVHAQPRAFRNGLPLDETNITATYMERAFDQLFREIEENLPGYVRAAP